MPNKIATNLHDAIFAIGGVALCIATIPAAFGAISTPVWTSAMLSGILFIFGINYLTMRYWWAAITIMIQAGLWSIVLIRGI